MNGSAAAAHVDPAFCESEQLFSDQLWRLNNLYWIVDEKGKRIKFRMTQVQLELFLDLWFMNLIDKSRQHGITTLFCIFFLDTALFNSNVRCGIIAHNREDAESFFQDKIKYAYDNLEDAVRALRPADASSSRELRFNNNSAIRVGTSMRSSTNQYLHISEFGKICARNPEKAREIVTGSLNTVHAGQFVAIESTAEGASGYFYDYVQEARRNQARHVELTPLQFKFFFYPWWRDPRNEIEPGDVVIPAPLSEYFERLATQHGIRLSARQKAWYAGKWSLQGDDMKREHPSTVEESFEVRIEGAYFKSQFARIYSEGRITAVPQVEGIPVNTYWDLGMDDTTAIWFIQRQGRAYRAIDYYAHNGEGLAFYARVLREKAVERGYEYGTHFAPHDIEVKELGTGVSRKEKAAEYGIDFRVAPKLPKVDQIEAARAALGLCWFDEARCGGEKGGIAALENYRKEWDEKNGCYRSTPLHDWASDGSDAFQIFAVTREREEQSTGGPFVPDRTDGRAHPFAQTQATFTPRRT